MRQHDTTLTDQHNINQALQYMIFILYSYNIILINNVLLNNTYMMYVLLNNMSQTIDSNTTRSQSGKFLNNTMSDLDKPLDFDYKDFTRLVIDESEYETALSKFEAVKLCNVDLDATIMVWYNYTTHDRPKTDVLQITYEYILEEARTKIKEVLGFDIVSDIKGGCEFYVFGDYENTEYDYPAQAMEQLRAKLIACTHEEHVKLYDDLCTRSFLKEIGF